MSTRKTYRKSLKNKIISWYAKKITEWRIKHRKML